MKPQTKKILIIAATVAVIAAIVVAVVVLRRRKNAAQIIDGLDITAEQKNALAKKVAELSSTPAFSKDKLKDKAKAHGYTYEQWIVIEAAYALYYTADWPLYNKIASSIKQSKP